MKIRLSRLAPRWIILKVKETPDGVPHICEEEDGIKRYGLGLTFDCPLHRRIHRITVFFENPLDGLPPPHVAISPPNSALRTTLCPAE